MKIRIRVTPRASREEVIEQDGCYAVRVTAAPHDGEANEAVIRLLARHFKVGKSRVRIIGGLASRDKVVEIEGC
jgi:uncharacterized protein (TIGR00251 family)